MKRMIHVNRHIKKTVSIITVLGLLCMSMAVSFAEPSEWAYDAAYWARTKNAFPQELLTSDMNTKQLTRESLAEILVYAYAQIHGVGIEALPAGEPFEDTENPLVGKAYQAGLMAGTTDIRFSPDTLVSRSDLVGSIKGLLLKENVTVGALANAPFTDYNQISSGYKSTVNYLYNLGVFSGIAETIFRPSQTATVEESLAVVVRVLKAHNWISVSDLETAADRQTLNGFSVPVRTATPLTIYSPSGLNGIRFYYTGLSSSVSGVEVERAHRQLVAVAERHTSYSYDAVSVLTQTLDATWDSVKKEYSVKTVVYINGSSGAVSSEPIFASNFIKISAGNKLRVDFVK